jgi:hypothetical protein
MLPQTTQQPTPPKSEQQRHIDAGLDANDLQYLSVQRGKPQAEVTYRTRDGKLITI